MTGSIDYQAVLADLEAKRGQLDAAIAGIKAILAGTTSEVAEGEGGQSVVAMPVTAPSSPRRATGGRPGQLTLIESDTFFGLSTAQAILKLLTMAKRPQTPKALADALHAGGQLHAIDEGTSYKNTYTALMRMKKSGQVVQTRQGDWGLAEWYTNKPKGPEEE